MRQPSSPRCPTRAAAASRTAARSARRATAFREAAPAQAEAHQIEEVGWGLEALASCQSSYGLVAGAVSVGSSLAALQKLSFFSARGGFWRWRATLARRSF